MAVLNYSKEDLLRGKLVDPGWYRSKVKSVEEKPSSTDSSQNWNVEFLIIGTAFEGVPVKRTFNEKAPGFAVDFLMQFGWKPDANGGSLDLHKTEGKTVKIHIINDNYQNRMTNKIDGFMPDAA
jgi:hypothetical protein